MTLDSSARTGNAPPVILVVDDHEDLRAMWRVWLELSGFVTIEARDGLEAVTQARCARPSLVVLDFSMPQMDGLDALSLFEAHPETATIPVIGVTGHGHVTERARQFCAACDVLLVKPAHPDVLLEAIRQLLPSS